MIEKINQIEQKVQQVGLQMKTLQARNEELSKENIQLKADLAANQEKVSALKERLAKAQQVVETPEGLKGEVGEKLRLQLDQYIKEIDKCIEWLQNS